MRPVDGHIGLLRVVLFSAVFLVMGVVIGAALMRLLAPPHDTLASPEFATVVAREGTIKRVIGLNASVRWELGAQAPIAGGGVLTEIRHSGNESVAAGDVVATIDLRPVTVGQGKVPMFRNLSSGAEGVDVRQLQSLLVTEGFLSEGDGDGTFGPRTLSAVRAWQHSKGVDPDGNVRASDLLFLPELPSVLVMAGDLEVGARLADGAPFVQTLSAPIATVSLPEGQAQLVTKGQSVILDPAGRKWAAVVKRVRTDLSERTAQQVAELAPAGPELICRDDCADVPSDEGLVLPAEIEIVPETAGVIVPTSAVVSDATGSSVVTADGQRLPVRVAAAANGEAVVEGIPPGLSVRAPALVPKKSGS